jgi:hypothetical protein
MNLPETSFMLQTATHADQSLKHLTEKRRLAQLQSTDDNQAVSPEKVKPVPAASCLTKTTDRVRPEKRPAVPLYLNELLG